MSFSKFKAALDAEYPMPDNPHQSVIAQAINNRAAFRNGWEACNNAYRFNDGLKNAALEEALTFIRSLPDSIIMEDHPIFGQIRQALGYTVDDTKLAPPRKLPYWEQKCPQCGALGQNATRGIPQRVTCPGGHTWTN